MSTMLNRGSCGCGCNPCVCECPPTIGIGCLPDMCPPRPCFFNGQLITADDLNALSTYFSTKNAILSKLAIGFGVLGGLRIRGAAGVAHKTLIEVPPLLAKVFPNPQVIAGTVIDVSAGAAIDAGGRILSMCSSRQIDVLALAGKSHVSERHDTCAGWFGDIPICQQGKREIVAREYFLLAELEETPARAVPQFSGGGPCDPAPSCNFSRRLETVRLRLVPTVPALYPLTGCLDPVAIPEIEAIFGGSFQRELMRRMRKVNGETAAAGPNIAGAPQGLAGAGADVPGGQCVKLLPQLVDYFSELVASACCTHPAVVLGRVLIANRVPAELDPEPGVLHPHYVFIDDAFPYRRLVGNQAQITTLLVAVLCSMMDGGNDGGGVIGGSDGVVGGTDTSGGNPFGGPS